MAQDIEYAGRLQEMLASNPLVHSVLLRRGSAPVLMGYSGKSLSIKTPLEPVTDNQIQFVAQLVAVPKKGEPPPVIPAVASCDVAYLSGFQNKELEGDTRFRITVMRTGGDLLVRMSIVRPLRYLVSVLGDLGTEVSCMQPSGQDGDNAERVADAAMAISRMVTGGATLVVSNSRVMSQVYAYAIMAEMAKARAQAMTLMLESVPLFTFRSGSPMMQLSCPGDIDDPWELLSSPAFSDTSVVYTDMPGILSADERIPTLLRGKSLVIASAGDGSEVSKLVHLGKATTVFAVRQASKP